MDRSCHPGGSKSQGFSASELTGTSTTCAVIIIGRLDDHTLAAKRNSARSRQSLAPGWTPPLLGLGLAISLCQPLAAQVPAEVQQAPIRPSFPIPPAAGGAVPNSPGGAGSGTDPGGLPAAEGSPGLKPQAVPVASPAPQKLRRRGGKGKPVDTRQQAKGTGGAIKAAPVQAAVAPANDNAYILGPGDGLQLTFLSGSYSQFGGSFELLSDGSATLPLLGTVVFDGLTISQASSWLQSMYARYLRRPLLNLQVVRQRPLQVSLVGEVENPGLYTLTPAESSTTQSGGGSISGPPTLVTAIQKAGGLTLNANLGDIRLQRRMPGSSTELRETNLNLIALLRTGDKRQNPYLFDGDTIIIGKADNPPDKVVEFGVANFSPASIKVMMVGEVRNPGMIEIPANTPLSKAVLIAGGPNEWRGKRSGVELIRLNRNGTVSSQFFNIDYSQKVSNNLNPPLRDGDAVVISRTLYAKANDAVGAIAAPLSNLVNLLGLITIISNTSN